MVKIVILIDNAYATCQGRQMLPLTATKNFALLTAQYRDLPIEFPHLKAVTLAQWGYESGWGKQKLAKDHGNYSNMRWGPFCLGQFGTPIRYGDGTYAQFTGLSAFVYAYWARFDDDNRAYWNWRVHSASAEQFIQHIAPQDQPRYARDVLDIVHRRTGEIFRG